MIYITLGFALYFFYLALQHFFSSHPNREIILAIWCTFAACVMLYYSGFIPGHPGTLG